MKCEQEMLHILTTAVRGTIHACIRNSKWSNIDVEKINFQKMSKFGHYLSFLHFLSCMKKPLHFIVLQEM